MESAPVRSFYNTDLNKLVTQKLRIEIMSLSYHLLRLVDVSIHVVAVHRVLACSVLPLRHNSKLAGRSVAAELFPDLRVLNQPIDPP
jgi:hypothetical protein